MWWLRRTISTVSFSLKARFRAIKVRIILANNKFKLNERYVIRNLSRYFDLRQNYVFPNTYICGGEMDVAVVTPRMYLTEIEVKLTLADWKADTKKEKWWSGDRKYVDRFFYAVPRNLVDFIPEFVQSTVGIISINDGGGLEAVRNAKKVGVKITDLMFKKLLIRTYHRFWTNRIENDKLKSLREQPAQPLTEDKPLDNPSAIIPQ